MKEPGEFRVDVDSVPGGQRFRLYEQEHALPVQRFLEHLGHNPAFRCWYTRLLVDSGPDGFFWELPPFSLQSMDEPAEFVLIRSLFLSSLTAERAPFDEHFLSNPDKSVITFENLGGDALLIVPTPLGDDDVYPHFAVFLRNAPPDQIDALWQETSHQARQLVGASPHWLSTAGLGVSWVHLRIDTRPKYYRFDPYKR